MTALADKVPKTIPELNQAHTSAADDSASQQRDDAMRVVSVLRPDDTRAAAPKPTFLNFRIRRALLLIESKYYVQELNLDLVSRCLGVTKPYLCRVFRREVGIGLPEYVCRFRAEKAEKLLRETVLSIKEISAAVGFGYVTQLDRAFKAEYGCTPKECRSRGPTRNSGGVGTIV